MQQQQNLEISGSDNYNSISMELWLSIQQLISQDFFFIFIYSQSIFISKRFLLFDLSEKLIIEKKVQRAFMTLYSIR